MEQLTSIRALVPRYLLPALVVAIASGFIASVNHGTAATTTLATAIAFNQTLAGSISLAGETDSYTSSRPTPAM